MSRGPGRIERAIEAVLDTEPDNAFTIEDLCRRIYHPVDEYPRVSKAQRVAVLRAARKVMERRDTMWSFTGQDVGGRMVYYTANNVMSYAMGRLKADGLEHYESNDLRIGERWRTTEAGLRARLAEGGDHHKFVVEGGAWWEHVQSYIEEIEARRSGDEARLEKVLADREAADARVMASLSV
jgi:hypothetical protein